MRPSASVVHSTPCTAAMAARKRASERRRSRFSASSERNRRALSIATAVWAAKPTMKRSSRSVKRPGSGWPKSSAPVMPAVRDTTDAAM